jgi:hypothetical protein
MAKQQEETNLQTLQGLRDKLTGERLKEVKMEIDNYFLPPKPRKKKKDKDRKRRFVPLY